MHKDHIAMGGCPMHKDHVVCVVCVVCGLCGLCVDVRISYVFVNIGRGKYFLRLNFLFLRHSYVDFLLFLRRRKEKAKRKNFLHE